VHKQLGRRREVKVDHVVKQRDVDAAGGDIGHNEDLGGAEMDELDDFELENVEKSAFLEHFGAF
jgi:hypothetical protein